MYKNETYATLILFLHYEFAQSLVWLTAYFTHWMCIQDWTGGLKVDAFALTIGTHYHF